MPAFIRTPRELKAQEKRRGELVALIAEQTAKLARDGKGTRQIERRLQPLRLRLREVEELIMLYARLTKGDTSVLRGMSPGVKLIGARIAAGMSQQGLAARLGVKRSQVSRDEANEYRTASVERFQRVAQVLGRTLDVIENSTAAPGTAAGAVRSERDTDAEEVYATVAPRSEQG